jgi:hypothetical protein
MIVLDAERKRSDRETELTLARLEIQSKSADQLLEDYVPPVAPLYENRLMVNVRSDAYLHVKSVMPGKLKQAKIKSIEAKRVYTRTMQDRVNALSGQIQALEVDLHTQVLELHAMREIMQTAESIEEYEQENLKAIARAEQEQRERECRLAQMKAGKVWQVSGNPIPTGRGRPKKTDQSVSLYQDQ